MPPEARVPDSLRRRCDFDRPPAGGERDTVELAFDRVPQDERRLEHPDRAVETVGRDDRDDGIQSRKVGDRLGILENSPILLCQDHRLRPLDRPDRAPDPGPANTQCVDAVRVELREAAGLPVLEPDIPELGCSQAVVS